LTDHWAIGKMTKKDLAKYLEKPETVGVGNLKDLQKLLIEYPYSATLRMLYLKGLKNEKDVAFDKELKKASISIPDRTVLFQLLKESDREQEEEVISGLIKSKDEKLSLEEKHEEEIKEESEKSQLTPKSQRNTDELEEIRMDKEIKSTVIGSQYILEVSDELPAIEDLMPKAKKNKKIRAREKAKPKSKEEKFDFFSFVQGKKEVKKENEKDKRLQEFIARKEKALKGKQAIFSTEKIAEKSLEENEDLVTETLAEIFVKQKKYGKAIKAYKRLSLKFPEKSVYFAARLKKVKKLKSKNK